MGIFHLVYLDTELQPASTSDVIQDGAWTRNYKQKAEERNETR